VVAICKEKSIRKAATKKPTKSPRPGKAQDTIARLRADHVQVSGLFSDFAKARFDLPNAIAR